MAGYPIYQVELRHDGLNKYRLIRGRDEYVVKQKAQTQLAAWDEQWRVRSTVLERQKERERRALEKEEMKSLAADRTSDAENALNELRSLLARTLNVHDAIDWDTLKDKSAFPEPPPKEPLRSDSAREPLPSDFRYVQPLTFLDKIFSSRRNKKEQLARAKFEDDHADWSKGQAVKDTEYKKRMAAYAEDLRAWHERKKIYLQTQDAEHQTVEQLKARYLVGDGSAIEEYCDLVLSRSEYPDFFPKEYEISFVSETGTIVVEYKLPALPELPTTKQVKYVASRDQLEDVPLRENELNAIYDGLVYQTCLRTIHELFEADQIKKIEAVVFNGWVEFIDPATGKEVRACIVSVQAARDAFSKINLARVEPRACFRALKGVGSSKLHSMVPVVPVLRLNRDDKRFIESVDVADKLTEGTNVAAIGWEEFEHLIREIFEKELSQSGGEVKVTRASRDGGVDAVAFDPDPIRGGKIVIQAKRYTNVVGVSAVRDLYGTVMNEGATKGILVTTSNYGPDAYEFAKDKPLTLLDGGNLLHLLEKHGHRAYINLNEAKKLNANT